MNVVINPQPHLLLVWSQDKTRYMYNVKMQAKTWDYVLFCNPGINAQKQQPGLMSTQRDYYSSNSQ